MPNNGKVLFVSKGRISCIFAIALFCSALVQGQTTIPALNDADYNAVLGRLFPRRVSTDAELVLVVRYEPSFTAESQITIVREKGKWRLFRQQSESGNVFVNLERIMEETSREDLDWLTTQITVKTQEVVIPQVQIEELQRQFINSLSRQLSREKEPRTITNGPIYLTLDQTRYRVWYRGAINVEFAIWGTDTDKRTQSSEPTIVRWAKKLRQATDNPSRASASNPRPL